MLYYKFDNKQGDFRWFLTGLDEWFLELKFWVRFESEFLWKILTIVVKMKNSSNLSQELNIEKTLSLRKQIRSIAFKLNCEAKKVPYTYRIKMGNVLSVSVNSAPIVNWKQLTFSFVCKRKRLEVVVKMRLKSLTARLY